MIREGFLQRVLSIFCESVIVHRSCFISDYFVAIVPEFQCNQHYSDIYFAINLQRIPLVIKSAHYDYYFSVKKRRYTVGRGKDKAVTNFD